MSWMKYVTYYTLAAMVYRLGRQAFFWNPGFSLTPAPHQFFTNRKDRYPLTAWKLRALELAPS